MVWFFSRKVSNSGALVKVWIGRSVGRGFVVGGIIIVFVVDGLWRMMRVPICVCRSGQILGEGFCWRGVMVR